MLDWLLLPADVVLRPSNFAICSTVHPESMRSSSAWETVHDPEDAHSCRGEEGMRLAGGYCDSEQTADGLLYNLSHGDEEDYGEILVTAEKPVKEAD